MSGTKDNLAKAGAEFKYTETAETIRPIAVAGSKMNIKQD